MRQLNDAAKYLPGNFREIGGQRLKAQDLVDDQLARFVQHKIRLRLIMALKTRVLQRQHIFPEAPS